MWLKGEGRGLQDSNLLKLVCAGLPTDHLGIPQQHLTDPHIALAHLDQLTQLLDTKRAVVWNNAKVLLNSWQSVGDRDKQAAHGVDNSVLSQRCFNTSLPNPTTRQTWSRFTLARCARGDTLAVSSTVTVRKLYSKA